MKLTIATCQFPISSDVRKNLRYVSRQIGAAKERGADVAHFPEAALSGYAGPTSPHARASTGPCYAVAPKRC